MSHFIIYKWQNNEAKLQVNQLAHQICMSCVCIIIITFFLLAFAYLLLFKEKL